MPVCTVCESRADRRARSCTAFHGPWIDHAAVNERYNRLANRRVWVRFVSGGLGA